MTESFCIPNAKYAIDKINVCYLYCLCSARRGVRYEVSGMEMILLSLSPSSFPLRRTTCITLYQSTKRFTHSDCHTFFLSHFSCWASCYESKSYGSKLSVLTESHGECSLEHFLTGSCSSLHILFLA